MSRRTIRASELGSFLYCRRAWWYQKTGAPSQNQSELNAGHDIHIRHGRSALRVGCIQVIAYSLILVALVLIAVSLAARAL